MNNKVCGIVVTFNSGSKLEENIFAILQQVDMLVIVDNNSSDNTLKSIKNLEDNHPEKIKLIINNENIGLASAQNLGLKFFLSSGLQWVLLLDDDTKVESNTIKNMLEYYDKLSENEQKNIGMLYPLVKDINTGSYTRYVTFGKLGFKFRKLEKSQIIRDKTIVMASGSLIKRKTISEIGYMKESLFIDGIDTDYSLRILKDKKEIHILGDALINHSLGERKEVKIGNKIISPTNHNPIRCYYIYRNMIYLIKKYSTFLPSFTIYILFINFAPT